MVAASDQDDLLTVQALTRKMQDGHSLSESEAAFLQSFRMGEIARLETQLQSTGLGERDRHLLEGLRSQEATYQKRSAELKDRSEEVEILLEKLASGRRVPVRQRLRMNEILSEERIRLEAKDDEVGLTSSEWKALKQIQETQEKKKKEETSRREKVEMRKQMLEGMR